MRQRWVTTWVVTVLVATLAAAPAPASASAPPEAEALPPADVNGAARDGLSGDGTLRLGVGALPTNWNPLHADAPPSGVADLLAPAMYTMWRFDTAGTPVLDTDYVLAVSESGGTAPDPSAASTPADSVPADPAAGDGAPCALPADPFTVTYTLNPEARWNDGSPITFADFAANWRALNGTDPAYDVASSAGYDRIGAVEQGSDEREVVVRFCRPYADFEALFLNLVPAAAVADPETFNAGWTSPNPDWLAGPFTVGGVDTDAGTFELVRNPSWWGATAMLDGISFRVVDGGRAPQLLANGELDSVAIGTDLNAYELAASIEGLAVRAAAGSDFRHLTVNMTAGGLAEQPVRQAIVLALDRAAIAAADLAGLPVPATRLDTRLAGATPPAELAAPDPAAAAALLDGAGWVLGDDGVRSKGDTPLAVTFSRVAGVRLSAIEAQLVAEQLGAVGFEVEIVDLPADTWFDSVQAGEFELITFTWLGTPFPHRLAAQLYRADAPGSVAAAETDEIEALLEALQTETDDTARAAVAGELDALLWQHAHTIPLFAVPDLVATRADLANWGAFGRSSPVWQDVGFTS